MTTHLKPHTYPDPGDGWYKLTFGNYQGCWVDFYNADVILQSNGECYFAKDAHSFAHKHPELYESDPEEE